MIRYAAFDRFELALTDDQVARGSHSGSCDADVLALSHEPEIACQLKGLDPAAVRDELRGYGAWDAAELADDAQNLQRILWIACGNIMDATP